MRIKCKRVWKCDIRDLVNVTVRHFMDLYVFFVIGHITELFFGILSVPQKLPCGGIIMVKKSKGASVFSRIKAVLKGVGAQGSSEKGVKSLQKATDDYATEVARRAAANAKHARRKRVTDADVELAINQMKRH